MSDKKNKRIRSEQRPVRRWGSDRQITAALNKLYSEVDSSLDPVLEKMQYLSLPPNDWAPLWQKSGGSKFKTRGSRCVRNKKSETRVLSARITISIPDNVFKKANALARKRKISRSALFYEAMAIYLATQQDDELTRRLHEYYDHQDSSLEPGMCGQQIRLLRSTKW
jgi:hypothetical protein